MAWAFRSRGADAVDRHATAPDASPLRVRFRGALSGKTHRCFARSAAVTRRIAGWYTGVGSVVYQVPPAAANFVDRVEEQAQAYRAVAERREPFRPLCLAVSGLAGVGKTELTYRIARELRPRYPDGVLYVDLDDLRLRGVVDPMEAVGVLLSSLEVAPEWSGGSFQARCNRYRTKTEGMRLIVIIDNARYESEVAPLLPASDASVVIVASQGPLADLEAGAAVEIPLAPLGEADAMELLWRGTDDPRLADDPESSLRLVRLCSGLPAALHVAARWIRRHQVRPLSVLAEELTAELHEKGVPAVEKVWDAAYASLSSDAARLYRLLADAPGPSFTAVSAVAILGGGEDTADSALEDLAAAGLAEPDVRADFGQGRIRLPELLRAHARRCALRHGDQEERAGAQRRIVSWYLRQAQRADALAAGPRLRLAAVVPPLPGAPDVGLKSKMQALRWMESERHALYGCVAMAYAHGLDSEAWALCEPLFTHYLDCPHYTDAIDAFRTGLAAAQRAENVAAVVRMRCQLARPYWEQGRFQDAERELGQALAASQALGDDDDDRKLKASVTEFRGRLHAAQGQWDDAAADFEAALHVHREIGNEYGVMLQTYQLGQAVAQLGEPERAAALLEDAHLMAGELGRERMTARTGFALAGVLRGLGQTVRAHELYVASLASARARGSSFDEARVLAALAALADESGESSEAREHRAAAHAIRVRNGAASV